jgi:hypothetical protein
LCTRFADTAATSATVTPTLQEVEVRDLDVYEQMLEAA